MESLMKIIVEPYNLTAPYKFKIGNHSPWISFFFKGGTLLLTYNVLGI